MDVEIGAAAGQVYRFLGVNKPSTVSQIKKGTGQKDAIVNQAIGWLAREDKVIRQSDGKTVRWSLAP